MLLSLRPFSLLVAANKQFMCEEATEVILAIFFTNPKTLELLTLNETVITALDTFSRTAENKSQAFGYRDDELLSVIDTMRGDARK